MKLEHGFTTREEWEEFFNQYYASIRLINQKTNELLHTKDGVESWIEKYKDCSALQRSIYVSGNQQIQRHIFWRMVRVCRMQSLIPCCPINSATVQGWRIRISPIAPPVCFPPIIPAGTMRFP